MQQMHIFSLNSKEFRRNMYIIRSSKRNSITVRRCDYLRTRSHQRYLQKRLETTYIVEPKIAITSRDLSELFQALLDQ